ncbi:hypothetical protein CRENPOLYSF2_2400035 [Crenothrix polyspora]|uniref:Uncharacterized protein n=1 Tax=Crenothrix polyspora TaxID=360316 RepID=A0A1R4H6E9_9GAMM|nr:hypothetical protein CRENPOLYSF2_2400035 [Crenothrix polyspora]
MQPIPRPTRLDFFREPSAAWIVFKYIYTASTFNMYDILFIIPRFSGVSAT